MAIKVLFDTDIGSDIDDAVCLAYLLAKPDCELLGITTVTGEPTERAKLASALCRVAGKDVPVYPGVERPFVISQHQPRAPQATALGAWKHDKTFPEGQAIRFMRDVVHQNPGEVVLLTVGPLTNLGLLFATYPEVPSMLKALVMMCGVFTNRLAGVGPLEWNARGDPHATDIAYRREVGVHRSIGLDVTCQVRMDAENVRKRFSAPLLRPVLDFAEVWFKHAKQITFHDPLAATTVFNDRICKFERGAVEVEMSSSRLLGMTHWTTDPTGRHEVALQVNPEAFFEEYFSVFE
jgi:inosine-uridine nucleoside N-ribohydrolase